MSDRVADVLADARVVEIQPGDMLVLEVSQPITPELAADIKRRVGEHEAFRGHDVVVLAGMTLKVARSA